MVENPFWGTESLRVCLDCLFVLFFTFLYVALTMPPFFHRPKGSDCGIVNVNIPTSGAEIGGAFGMCSLSYLFSMLESVLVC